MPLELRRQRNGQPRDCWYARYEIGGRRFVINLGVKVQGDPPASMSLREKGSMDFECSRVAAQAKLDQIVEEARSKRGSAHLVERLRRRPEVGVGGSGQGATGLELAACGGSSLGAVSTTPMVRAGFTEKDAHGLPKPSGK